MSIEKIIAGEQKLIERLWNRCQAAINKSDSSSADFYWKAMKERFDLICLLLNVQNNAKKRTLKTKNNP